jgi:hypothetical protein
VRVVNPVTSGLGGPQVKRRQNGSQGPAHASRGRNGFRKEMFSPAKSEVRPVFFLNPWGEDRQPAGMTRSLGKILQVTDSFVKGLILAQNERWRRGLGMQVERAW